MPAPLPRTALLLSMLFPAAAGAIEVGTVGPAGISFEGLLQSDYSRYHSDVADLGGPGDTGMRRAELVLKGKGPGRLEWVAGYDATGDKWLDVNARLRFGPEGAHWLRLGQAKQAVGMEELSSTKNNDFIAKAAATNTFALARRAGAAWGYGSGDLGVSAGWFGREISRTGATGDGYALRGTWAPVNRSGRVLHLGLSAARMDAPDGGLRLRARPDADLTDVRLVDSGLLADARAQTTTGAEAAWIQGPMKLQGEYLRSRIDRAETSAYTADGWYASAVWNLGGEQWSYRDGLPVTPGPDRHTGPWQLGLRYDRIDLDDGRAAPAPEHVQVDGILGGTMSAWTIGISGYLGPHTRLWINYVDVSSARLDTAAGRVVRDSPAIVQARLQLHW